jgi:hypothetical protein
MFYGNQSPCGKNCSAKKTMTFKKIYQHYLQHGFCITMVHADGEFAPLKVLIESLPGGPNPNPNPISDFSLNTMKQQ